MGLRSSCTLPPPVPFSVGILAVDRHGCPAVAAHGARRHGASMAAAGCAGCAGCPAFGAGRARGWSGPAAECPARVGRWGAGASTLIASKTGAMPAWDRRSASLRRRCPSPGHRRPAQTSTRPGLGHPPVLRHPPHAGSRGEGSHPRVRAPVPGARGNAACSSSPAGTRPPPPRCQRHGRLSACAGARPGELASQLA